jgi:deoxyribodipyrimidine photolyase
MRLAIMLFTRDLRLQDNPALDAAARRAQAVVPLFVLDDRLVAAPRRVRFLLESLTDLRAALRERGGDLIIRRGDPVTEVIGLARDTGARRRVLRRRREWLRRGPAPQAHRRAAQARRAPGPASGGICLVAATGVEQMAVL